MAASKILPNSSYTAHFVNKNIKNKQFDDICAKITAIYFDLDNTLIPTRAGDTKAIRKLSDVLESQFAFSKDESTVATQGFLKAFRRCPDNTQTSLDSWRTYLWRESLPTKHKHLAEQIYPKWLQLRYRYLALTADYVKLLKRLRHAGFALALITNGPSNAQWEKVQKLHISQYFDCILVSSDLPWEKPHPNIFYAACNFLNVKPHKCAMIGDKLETDIKGGHLANLGLTLWTPLSMSSNTFNDISDVEYPPHVTLNNLLELYKYFPQLNAVAVTSSAASAVASTNAAAINVSSSTTSASATIMTTTASMTAVIPNGGVPGSASVVHNRRRCSQINTCDSGRQQHQLPQQQQHQQQQQQQQQLQQDQQTYRNLNNNNNKCSNLTNRSRVLRGSSLPAAIIFGNSDAENSCDSIYS